jgi:valyl-tRNA synthetase
VAAEGQPTLAERWIGSRVAGGVQRATAQLDAFDLAGYTATVHELAWSDYADWFVEMAKLELRREDATAGERTRVWTSLATALADLLRLLHPLMPFVTEEIWAALHAAAPDVTHGEDLLMTAHWPSAGQRDDAAEAEMGELMATIRDIRNLRTDAGAPAGSWLPLVLEPADQRQRDAITRALGYLGPLARVRPITFGTADQRPQLIAATPLGAAWLGAETGESGAAGERRARQVEELQAAIDRVSSLLGNAAFVERAPESVVGKERARLAELREQLRQLG